MRREDVRKKRRSAGQSRISVSMMDLCVDDISRSKDVSLTLRSIILFRVCLPEITNRII